MPYDFKLLTAEDARYLATTFGSPLYLMDVAGVEERLEEFNKIALSHYTNSHIALSYKTNLLHELLRRLHNHGAFAEVTSIEEYTVAKRLGLSGSQIIFNGPMKTFSELKTIIADGVRINCDNIDEIDRIEIIAREMSIQVKIGLRLCFPEGVAGWSRFGFLVKEREAPVIDLEVIKKILSSAYLSIGGLHCQLGTNIRDIEKFAQLGRDLFVFSEKLLAEHGIALSWINVGGGLAGISPTLAEGRLEQHPIPNLSEYLFAIVTPLKPYLSKVNPLLFFEPGRTLMEPFGALLMEIVSRRELADGGLGLVCNAGYTHVPTCKVYNHPLTVPTNEDIAGRELTMTTLFGPTCNAIDTLHTPMMLPKLKPEDTILMYGVGAYSMAWSYSFIRLKPGIIFWSGGREAIWARLPETVEHLSRLEVTETRPEIFVGVDIDDGAVSGDKRLLDTKKPSVAHASATSGLFSGPCSTVEADPITPVLGFVSKPLASRDRDYFGLVCPSPR